MNHDKFALPLAAIRAFEAAARLNSFTRAAEELGLTQSAVSRHVRALEDGFSTQLFNRHGRTISLTAAGETYYGPVAEGMSLIRSGNQQMRRRAGSANQVTVSLLPSVAALWLAPRLADFTARNPAIELHMHASRALVDFSVGDVDLSIRYGRGDWADARSELLTTETLTPVCSPDFAREHLAGANAGCLADLPLLTDDLVDDWEHWFDAVGLAHRSARPSLRFDDSASLYLAAANGLGVALGRSLLIERALRDGQLVAPFPDQVPATYSYWLVRPSRGEPSPAARKFRNWVRAQAGSLLQEPPFGRDPDR